MTKKATSQIKQWQISPFNYQGSKRKDLKFIDQNIPKNFKTFIDVCGGMGSVSFHMIRKFKDGCEATGSKNENIKFIYNDIDTNLTELFNTLKNEDKLLKLIDDVNKKPVSVEYYKEFLKEEKSLPNYIYGKLYGFRGIPYHPLPNLRYSKGKILERRDISSERLLYFKTLCEKMDVLNLDMKEIIEKYKDDSDTFIYVDPPYLQKGTDNKTYSRTSFEDIDYLVSVLNSEEYKCKILLHIDFSGYIYAMLKDKIKFYYPKNYAMSVSKKQNYHPRYVCLVSNY